MGFIHSNKRNKMSVERAIDLTYVYQNLRIVDVFQEEDYRDALVEWVESEAEEEGGASQPSQDEQGEEGPSQG